MPTMVGSGADHSGQCCRRLSAMVPTIVSTKRYKHKLDYVRTEINYSNNVHTSARLTFIKSAGAILTCNPRTPALT